MSCHQGSSWDSGTSSRIGEGVGQEWLNPEKDSLIRGPIDGDTYSMLLLPLFQALQPRSFAASATEDVANVSPCEMESIINQLMNPSPEYQLHVSHLLLAGTRIYPTHLT